jgi:hypothetical protein
MTESEKQLLDLYLDGELPDDQQAALLQGLESNPNALAWLAERALLHEGLGAAMKSQALQQVAVAEMAALPSARRPGRWFSWRPLTAAAAGLVIGLFSASVVFAYVGPLLGKAMTLLQEGFESGPAPEAAGLPREIGRWSGDFTEIVAEQQGVRPAKGGKMLRFLSADYEGKSNAGPSRTASVWLLVDLRPYRSEFADGGAVAQLSAALNAQAFPQDRSYFEFVQIHSLDAAMVAALKQRHWTEVNNSSLALTRSAGVELDRDPATWQRIDCEQRLPGNADFLLIEIGLKQMPKTNESAEFAGHYLDDVRLTLARRPLLP